MTIREQRRAAIQRQQAIVSAARNENRALTESEQADFDNLQRTIENLTTQIEAEERQASGAASNAAAAGSPAATEPTAADQQRDAATAEERRRAEGITALCRDFNLDPTQYIRSGATMESVQADVLNQLRGANPPIPTGASVNDTGENDFRRDASDAMVLRSGLNVTNPTTGARQLQTMSLRDLAIECLAREGRNVNSLLRMPPDQLYNEMARQFYNPTAAFPAILDDTIRKSIVVLYNSVPTTFQEITTKGSLKDFKQTADHEYVIGGVGDFLLVPENGEIKPDKPSTERLPQRKLDTYGKSFSMSRQAFINDDIGFITEVPGLYATSAKKTIDKQVYTLLYSNPTIFDGKPLFHADHKNLIGSGAAPSQSTIQEIILKAQKQTDHFGDPIYVTPSKIVCGVGYEFVLAVIFGSTQVTGSSNNDINPLHNYPMGVVQSPMLNALAGANACPWFMLADPSIRGIHIDYFNGQETPTVRRMETPGQLGFVWDMYLDWGIAVRDFRGIYKNPGAVIA